MKRFAVLSVVVLLILSACAPVAPAAVPSPQAPAAKATLAKPEKEKIVIAVGGQTAIFYLPLTVIDRKGFFKEQGLDVEIQNFQGGAKALEALTGGSADVVVGFMDHTIQMQAKGKEIEAVTLFSRYPGLVLAVRSDLADKVKQVSDLKGMKVGVTAPGSSTHFMLNYLLNKQGLKPTDVSVIGIGPGATAVAAVEQKQVDALVNADPTITLLETKGLIKIMADTRTEKGTLDVFGGPYPAAVIYANRDFIDHNPIVIQRIVNAAVKGLQWMHTATPEQIADVLPESFYAGDKKLYMEMLAKSANMFSPDGLFPEDGAKTAYSVLSLSDETIAKAKIDLTKTFTNDFVKKVPAQ